MTTAAEVFRNVMLADPPASMSAHEQETFEHLFGEVWSRPGLGRRERRLVTLVCTGWAVTGDPIMDQAYAALKSGDLSIEELLEVVLHFAVYCGWPKASNLEMYIRFAWNRLQEEKGADTALPPLPADDLGELDWERRLERGREEFLDVNFGPIGGDTPYQHSGITGFVFGHVWQRPGLGRRDRRFVTVACVGLCEAPIPISSHVGSALRSENISPSEMDELIRQVEGYSGPRIAGLLRDAFEQATNESTANPA